jgi:hypothetical protein
MAEDHFGAADHMQPPENDMADERQQALRLAEVFTEACLELKANAPNLDIDELRTSGQLGGRYGYYTCRNPKCPVSCLPSSLLTRPYSATRMDQSVPHTRKWRVAYSYFQILSAATFEDVFGTP